VTQWWPTVSGGGLHSTDKDQDAKHHHEITFALRNIDSVSVRL
jgi:hypothetical protein